MVNKPLLLKSESINYTSSEDGRLVGLTGETLSGVAVTLLIQNPSGFRVISIQSGMTPKGRMFDNAVLSNHHTLETGCPAKEDWYDERNFREKPRLHK